MERVLLVIDVLDAASEHGIQVAVIQHTAKASDTPVFRKGSPEWELHPEIAKHPHDFLVEKDLP